MNKLELQQQAELVINPINLVTEMGFKLIRIDSSTTLWFNREDKDDDKIGISYYYLAKIKSHTIGLTYYPKRNISKYEVWSRKEGSSSCKGSNQRFDNELELLVFLKQSKFKIK
jgi:hypothetical protein